MTILVDYLRKWHLQLSIGIGKIDSAAYHLDNKEAKRELDVFVDNKRLVCQQAPKYLGVRLDRMLNFRQHLDEVAGKVTSRVAINSSLRTIYGCLKPTPVFQLPVLVGIAPAGLRREAATLALARKAVKHDLHILPDTIKNEMPPCRLNSRKPYNKEAQEMLSVIHEDRSKDAQRGSRSAKHPDPPEYIATYRTQEKAAREKN